MSWAEPRSAQRIANERPAHLRLKHIIDVMPARSIRLLDRPHRRRISAMTHAAKTVLAEALELDDKERAELAAELIASLDGEPDEGAEAAWATEIERRMADIDDGTATLTSWAEVERRIEEEILKK